jgi:hypothetical protein
MCAPRQLSGSAGQAAWGITPGAAHFEGRHHDLPVGARLQSGLGDTTTASSR